MYSLFQLVINYVEYYAYKIYLWNNAVLVCIITLTNNPEIVTLKVGKKKN